MKLGLHIGYWGLWGGAEEQLTAVKTAEEELRRYIAGEPLQNVVQAAI